MKFKLTEHYKNEYYKPKISTIQDYQKLKTKYITKNAISQPTSNRDVCLVLRNVAAVKFLGSDCDGAFSLSHETPTYQSSVRRTANFLAKHFF